MAEPFIIGFDTSSDYTGWCAGPGDQLPVAGAFPLVNHGSKLGPMGDEFSAKVMAVHRQFPATHWLAEMPILVPQRDTRLDLLKLYGVFVLLATLAHKLNIEFQTVDVAEAKIELTGDRKAKKPDMVRMARKMGVALPGIQAHGMFDAADATAVWKVGVRRFARRHLAKWDTAIYSNRGLL
jgi:hypothetical protein